ncbi:zinc-binding dehydrogenase [Streptomyces sp. NPDC046821]|uniref:quinone oxidoreductase family protein n=1 Tax=Streptomyces sp. NPDC046821 TaxID=3154702 RepID=UPI0033F5B171
MQAVRLNAFGSVDNFEVVDLPEPQAGPGEFRVKVEYSGLRWGDITQRRGNLKVGNQPPLIGGLEVAGRIDQVGEGAAGYELGQRVMAAVPEGGFAEYVVIRPDGIGTNVWPIPENVASEKMLAYPVNMLTAYHAVYTWADVQDGETVLVHAATGGIGLLIVQILKRRFKNVTVVGICSSPEKAELLLANGCDHAVNRKTTDYVEEINRVLGPKATGFNAGGDLGGGVDVSFNGISGETIEKDLQVIRKRGRLVIYGFQGGDKMPVVDTDLVTYDSITVMPFSQVAWRDTPQAQAADKFIDEWLRTEDLIEPEIWPLSKVAEAENAFEDGRATGKVVFAASA